MSRLEPKLKPFANALREQVSKLQPLCGTVFSFALGDWKPSHRFWEHTGERMGMKLTVRTYNGGTFVFRMT